MGIEYNFEGLYGNKRTFVDKTSDKCCLCGKVKSEDNNRDFTKVVFGKSGEVNTVCVDCLKSVPDGLVVCSYCTFMWHDDIYHMCIKPASELVHIEGLRDYVNYGEPHYMLDNPSPRRFLVTDFACKHVADNYTTCSWCGAYTIYRWEDIDPKEFDSDRWGEMCDYCKYDECHYCGIRTTSKFHFCNDNCKEAWKKAYKYIFEDNG